ncbi:putative transcriptional regulator, ModE family [Pedosphaera parvula Ellin514]|uniref:Putative transcriptional regulator, ModE family n=2 Tax=Pedosphaera TaxID=1032526 RepID=B9XM86_PEDPL|nr:LysR family transcriptional regulator [Pedosphaera parvula]EEF59079.1 putative transcriptional regulator, ModE family [Pedosphaera parvula Ellin514]
MGPGKAELLEQLQKTGSIADAAQNLGMSYMRAWKLIKTMEECFKEPLVLATRGGSKGGGAGLSAAGEKVLRLYRELEAKSLKASAKTWAQMVKFLAD